MTSFTLLFAAVVVAIAGLVWWKISGQASPPPDADAPPQPAPPPTPPTPTAPPTTPPTPTPKPVVPAPAPTPAPEPPRPPVTSAAPAAAPPSPALAAAVEATVAAAAQAAAAVAAGIPASPPKPAAATVETNPEPAEPSGFADTHPIADPSDLPEHDGFAELAESLAPKEPQADPHSAIHSFVWAYEHDLPDTRRDALMSVIGGIPCPPQSLHQLLAPDFFDRIGPGELTDLLRGEPLIAAKVLATVNAPFYGLGQPVTNIEHAVAFLGMETVRNICVQYLLAQAFKPELSSSQRSFDTIWRASSIASELALRLGKALNLPDYGALATKVVMAFVGHLAAAALLPRNAVDEWLLRSRMERAQIEQEVLGLSAGEIGTLVLRVWALPGELVSDVSDASRVLVTPASAVEPRAVPYLALSYLCVGLGERLALGDMFSLAGYDPLGDEADENYHLRSYLEHPALAKLGEVMASPEIVALVQQMRGTGATWP